MNTADILDKLAHEGRKLKLGQVLPEGEVTLDTARRVQADFRVLLEQPGVTVDMIAKALAGSCSRTTLGRFRNRDVSEFPGDLDRVVRVVNQFMETLGRRREAKPPTGFVETDVARRMLAVIAKTTELCAIGIITGDSGRGKSLTLEAAHSLHPGSVLLRVRQSSRRPRGLAKQLGKALNLRGCDHLARSQDNIIEALRGTGRLLLIDEAHQLSSAALELLRDVHDETGCPIVLAGTLRLEEAVADSDVYSGQLSSRVAIRYNIVDDMQSSDSDPSGGTPLHSVDEIRKLYEGGKLRLTDDGLRLLTKIANVPGLGGLRLCAKVAQVALSVTGGEPIDGKAILQVIRMLHGRSFAVGRIERAIRSSSVKVA